MYQAKHKSFILKTVLIISAFLVMLCATGCSSVNKINTPKVKKSYSGVCYEKGKPGYNETKVFIDYESIGDCVRSGGHTQQ